ncbi:MAG TPA: hypothetical protein DD666_01465 [Advenella kashmirensis]|uniref:Uncharacterized protein n=1 Tax=Advenella kashmirensis TaxID=310575 RepID=A0A356LBC7_9BURK|nr:hypothetical protein [Advenella kashmirensis]
MVGILLPQRVLLAQPLIIIPQQQAREVDMLEHELFGTRGVLLDNHCDDTVVILILAVDDAMEFI